MANLNRFYTLILAVAMAFTATLLCAQAPPAKSDDIPLPEGKGRDVAKRICGTCHSTNVWAAQRHTRDQWSGIIDNMISKGAEGSDEELAQILDYLSTNFAPPNEGERKAAPE